MKREESATATKASKGMTEFYVGGMEEKGPNSLRHNDLPGIATL